MAESKHWTEELLVRVLPIWNGQIGYACELMETTIIGLTMKFSEIVNCLHRLSQARAVEEELASSEQRKTEFITCIENNLDDLKDLCEKNKNPAGIAKIEEVKINLKALLSEYDSSMGYINEENKAIKNQVEELLVDLQFQDRVSQILRQVVQAQQQLKEVVSESIERRQQGNELMDFDVEKWVDNLKSSYAMDDQLKIHDEDIKNKSIKQDEITFF